MKIIASTVLLFFVLFLAMPTIIFFLENEKDSIELCEDSNTPSSSVEEIKHVIKYYEFISLFEVSFFDSVKDFKVIIFENFSKHDLVFASIFIPPPNFI
jgi:hypothetical protein